MNFLTPDANETSANEATTLAQHIQEISNFCQELNSSLATMSDFINIYKASNEDISSIAGQTNLLSLNASIEAEGLERLDVDLQ